MALPFETNWGPNGEVIQSGVRSGPDGSQEPNTSGYLCEAVVLAIYYPEEEDAKRASAMGTQVCITADVRTVGRRSMYLSRVPVYQLRHGIYDEDLWVPRPCSCHLDGADKKIQGDPSGSSPPTPAESMDGDRVLVAWLHNNPNCPFILPIALPHPRAKNLLAKSEGRVRRIRHQGTLIQIDKEGSLTLDATTAAKEELASGAVEQLSTGGDITLKTKAANTIKLDGDKTEVSSGATDYLIKGTTFKQSFASLQPAVPDPVGSANATLLVNAILVQLKAMALSTKAKVG